MSALYLKFCHRFNMIRLGNSKYRRDLEAIFGGTVRKLLEFCMARKQMRKDHGNHLLNIYRK